MIKKMVITVLAAAMLAGSGLFVVPSPAKADTNSTIAIAAAAIVGLLAFDEFNRPYYINDGYRCYVPDDVAFYYFQNYYGGWYGGHMNDWYYNRARFAYDWNNSHGYNGGGYGYNGGYNNGGYDRRYTSSNQPPVNYDRGYNGGYQRPVNYDRGYQGQPAAYRGGYQSNAYRGYQSNAYRGGNDNGGGGNRGGGGGQGDHHDRGGDRHGH
jgi:hypothetical protein